jgi:hypothetical protein
MELGVAVWLVAAFECLSIRLQTVIRCVQQIGDRLTANAIALLVQFFRQVSQAFACPSQGRLWIAPRGGFHQGVQCFRQTRLRLGQPQATCAWTTHPSQREGIPLDREFLQSGVDRTTGYSRRPMHQRNSAVSSGLRLSSRPKPSLPFIQNRFQFGKPLPNRRFHACVSHGNDYINSHKKL